MFPDAGVYESSYESLQPATKTQRDSAATTVQNDDLERLERMASLLAVETKEYPRTAYQPYTRSVSSVRDNGPQSVAEPLPSDAAFTPVNRGQAITQTALPSSGGIDLSTTSVASTQARKIRLDYLLKRGTYIGCVLKTRIVSDQAGYISCSITEDIYSANGATLLLPRGSDVLGEYKPKSLSNGKVRLHAVWDVVTTPEGIRVELSSPSTGTLGAAGLSGHVNQHYTKRVGIPILLSLFRTAMDYRTRNVSGESGAYQESGSDAADGVLQEQINEYEAIRPTLTKRQGTTIGIMVARDVSFEQVLAGRR